MITKRLKSTFTCTGWITKSMNTLCQQRFFDTCIYDKFWFTLYNYYISSLTRLKGQSQNWNFFICKFETRGQTLSHGIRTYGPNSLDSFGKRANLRTRSHPLWSNIVNGTLLALLVLGLYGDMFIHRTP